jgi:hypothetical protein
MTEEGKQLSIVPRTERDPIQLEDRTVGDRRELLHFDSGSLQLSLSHSGQLTQVPRRDIPIFIAEP